MCSIYEQFEGFDRYDMPESIVRVTAGEGSDVYLINCRTKVAMYDCGMAYCNKKLIENIDEQLHKWGKKSIDVIFVSHSHYDHIGALPYILKRWETASVAGAKKSADVFKSKGALALIKKLGEAARDTYGVGDQLEEEIISEGLRVDIVLEDEEKLELGDKSFIAYSTPGHTDCSMSYMMMPERILFASESTGILRSPSLTSVAILKSFDQAVESAKKCKSLHAKEIIGSHYGRTPSWFADEYFDLFLRTAEYEQKAFAKFYDAGLSTEEMLVKYDEMNWNEQRAAVQPRDAFSENAKHIIKCYIDKHIKDNNLDITKLDIKKDNGGK